MKTIVYQSYRTHDVPAWLTGCMGSVRDWARQNSFDYHFAGDEFLALAPEWYRAKAGTEICPVTDLSRLLMAQQFLARGYDLTIWVDADVLVFRHENMNLAIERGFAFCHEIWTGKSADGQPVIDHRVNNSVSIFARNNVHLGFFIDACLQIARHSPALGKLAVGTAFLSQLRNILPFPLIRNVGMLSPVLMADISRGETLFLSACAQQLPVPLACANLCASLQDSEHAGILLRETVYDAVVDSLLASKGEVINRWHPSAPTQAM